MKKFITTAILLLFSLRIVYSVNGAAFAIYTDNNTGTWQDGIVAFEQFLKWKGISYERITPLDVNSVILKDYYDAIYFPGGDADYYNAAIDENGIAHIRELVNNGGGYIGMCAGAEFACDTFIWEGVSYDYPLDLFMGTAVGPIDEIAPWPEYAMTTLNMNPRNPLNAFEPPTERMLYYGGSSFYPDINMQIDTVASWDAYEERNAIINFEFGDGRVLLLGPHPEIEEDSDRDSSDVAEELDDLGTDWNFLWSAVDWLLKDTITQPPISAIRSIPDKINLHLQNNPNPFNPGTAISYQLSAVSKVQLLVYNALGQKVSTLVNSRQQAGKYSVTFNAANLASGVYYYTLKAGNKIRNRKMILLR